MFSSVAAIVDILDNQIIIYSNILELETEKGEAITSKQGALIQEKTSSQDKLLRKVESLENERLSILKNEFITLSDDGDVRSITLKAVAAVTGNPYSDKIIEKGKELKSLLLKVKAKQEANAVILKDNMEYFDILISGLKNSSSIKSGYGSDGREREKIVNPVLFNKQA